jgi:hypothetical protein
MHAGDGGDNNIFLIDPELIGLVTTHVQSGTVKPRYEVYVRDSVTGLTRMLLVDEPDGTLDTVLAKVGRGVGLPVDNAFEEYFWMFWRGWMGMLDAEVLSELPVRDDLVAQIRKGKPLRGEDLDRLADALGWHFANTTSNWGDDVDWQQWTLTPPHKKARRMVREYVTMRMTALYGEGYVNAPV